MVRSQNATFRGAEPESEGDRIRGETITDCLAVQFNREGWHIGEIDCWRDAGYFFSMERGGDALQIIVTAYYGKTDCWILQIAPSRMPGFIRRWLGAVPSASPDCVFRAAIETQRILSENGFTNFRWCWDDLADGDHCDDEPPPPQ